MPGDWHIVVRDAECEPCRGKCPCYGGGTSLSGLVLPAVIRESLISAPGAPAVRLDTAGVWLGCFLSIVVLAIMVRFVWWVMRWLIVLTFTNVRQFVIDPEIAAGRDLVVGAVIATGRDPVVGPEIAIGGDPVVARVVAAGRDPVVDAVIAEGVGWVIAALIIAVAGFAVNRAIASVVGQVNPAATATVPFPSLLNYRRQSRDLQRGGASRVRAPTASSPSDVPRIQQVRQPIHPTNRSRVFLRYAISPEQQPAVELPQPAPPPVADPVVALPVTLNQLAENASILLERFSQGSHANDIVSDEHHTIITNATAGVLTINARLRQANQRARPREEVIPEPDCIICYAECADTLFMPCAHMVICTVRISSASRGSRSLIRYAGSHVR